MDESIHCQIQIKGHLSNQWHNWFGGLEIENQVDGKALLCGTLKDQSALYGVLNRMRDLGLFLLSLKCVEIPQRAENEKWIEGDDVRYRSTHSK